MKGQIRLFCWKACWTETCTLVHGPSSSHWLSPFSFMMPITHVDWLFFIVDDFSLKSCFTLNFFKGLMIISGKSPSLQNFCTIIPSRGPLCPLFRAYSSNNRHMCPFEFGAPHLCKLLLSFDWQSQFQLAVSIIARIDWQKPIKNFKPA